MTKELTDRELHALAKKYGQNALLWRQKFIGLLPAIFKRRIYKRYGYASIFEYAAKLAGISHEQVQRTLSLERKLQQTPALQHLLVSGEVSVNKLARVASRVTPANEEFWATQVRVLPNRALETLVRDNRSELVHVHNSEPEKLSLSAEVEARLIELQQKGIDVNDLLLEFLAQRELEIAQEKERLGREAPATSSRHIPSKTRRLLQKEHGTCCSITGCRRPATSLHHTQRFALTSRHDPRYIAPLCREHHSIAHAIDLKMLESRRW